MRAFDWLADIHILDITTGPGSLAPMVLAEYGAKVTRVAPFTSDPLASEPPFARGNDGEPVSLRWLLQVRHAARSPLSLATEEGRRAFVAALAGADAVVASMDARALGALGVDGAALRARFPRLTWAWVTPFGPDGPHADWQATDLIGMASGGLLSLCGDRDLPPLRVSVEQAYAQAGIQLLPALLIALRQARLTGEGQEIDLSMQAAVTNCLGNARLVAEVDGTDTLRAGGGRATGAVGARLVYPCADGYVSFARMPDSLPALYDWMLECGVEPGFDPAELAALPQAGRGMAPPELTARFDAAVEALFAQLPKAVIYEDGQRRGLMTCPVATPADLLENAQLRYRGFWQTEHIPELGRAVELPGPPVRVSVGPAASPSPRRVPAPANGLPLAGVRVADFSWVGVAPCATQLLALFGAEVIRVESARKLDVFRGSLPRRGSDPNASAYWANCNRDKRGATLDLRHPRGREVALRLVAEADVVVDSFTPGFMDSVGLSVAAMREVNPGLITMSASMEGSDGPHAAFRGFGLVLQSTVGFTHFTAWPGRAPVGTGVAYTDWFATHFAAFALLAALEARERTGVVASIDLSQLEACTWGLDAEVLRWTVNRELRPPQGNRHEGMVPHGVFPAAGEDRWLALAVRSATEWRALAALLGEPWAGDAALDELPARREREDAIEAAIATWTGPQDAGAAATTLQAHGIPAYPVLGMLDLAEDAQLRHREQFWPLVHPEIGRVHWDSPAFRLSRLPVRHRQPAPLLGGDNDYVFRELLGYTEAELADLAASGAFD